MALGSAWGAYTFFRGKATATAGTVINVLCPPRRRARTKVTELQVTAGTTAHTITAMRPIGWAMFTADAAASQAVVILSADPGNFTVQTQAFTSGIIDPLPNTLGPVPSATAPVRYKVVTGLVRAEANVLAASAHNVAYQMADGTFVVDTISGTPVTNADGTLTVTLATNIGTGGVKQNGVFWLFGATTSKDPYTNIAHPQFTVPASATTTLVNQGGGPIVQSNLMFEPILIQDNNATVAGTIEVVSGLYSP